MNLQEQLYFLRFFSSKAIPLHLLIICIYSICILCFKDPPTVLKPEIQLMNTEAFIKQSPIEQQAWEYYYAAGKECNVYEAISFYTKARVLAETYGPPGLVSRSYIRSAELYLSVNAFDRALSFTEAAIKYDQENRLLDNYELDKELLTEIKTAQCKTESKCQKD